ncbi:hypothetical protein GXP67_36625 [Rhodocytophaga rosea]|uniref:Uncharacterized protein n=1 Tax=Rhodocytophaga rosea TaxID=2704465 RepID=A0A6C0GUB6_9BACT|nr:hypothetical protein [Rhodocytophaga rosea]QHT71799.1 hypothetical protein GXP67_36625 [Rhodocytophaga rosea]
MYYFVKVKKSPLISNQQETTKSKAMQGIFFISAFALLMSLSTILLTGCSAYAQAPNYDPDKKLYRECELVVAGFTSCKECEDKEMTLNCKDYYCDATGKCELVPVLPYNKPRQLVKPLPKTIGKAQSRPSLKPVEGQQLSAFSTPPATAANR